MDRAGARLDAYAHHPYPDYPGDTPFAGGCGHCKTISMSTLERLLREVGKAFPRASIWLTEYAYQSTPDPFGVSPQTQARFVSDAARRVYAAPRVEMLIHYLYRDEPDLARWQSGLETVDGDPKPALNATMLPLTQVSRKGTPHDRLGPGAARERPAGVRAPDSRRRRMDREVGGSAETTRRGATSGWSIAAARGSQAPLWYPAVGSRAATLVVR